MNAWLCIRHLSIEIFVLCVNQLPFQMRPIQRDELKQARCFYMHKQLLLLTEILLPFHFLPIRNMSVSRYLCSWLLNTLLSFSWKLWMYFEGNDPFVGKRCIYKIPMTKLKILYTKTWLSDDRRPRNTFYHSTKYFYVLSC